MHEKNVNPGEQFTEHGPHLDTIMNFQDLDRLKKESNKLFMTKGMKMISAGAIKTKEVDKKVSEEIIDAHRAGIVMSRYRTSERVVLLKPLTSPVLPFNTVSGWQPYQSSRSLSSLSGSKTFLGLPSKLRSHSHLRVISSDKSPLSISTTCWPIIGRNFQPCRVDQHHSGQLFQIFRLTWKEPEQKLVSRDSLEDGETGFTGCGYV